VDNHGARAAAMVGLVILLFVIGGVAITCDGTRPGSAAGDSPRTRGPVPWLRTKWRNMAKYEWIASNSAPKGCPMEITSGDFLFPNGGSLYIPPKLLHAGWGTKVSLHAVGDDTKSLPDRMQITFYSYLEDKIYQGSFKLPYEQISDLFADGYRAHRDKSGWSTFDSIVAGVAPGGTVAVWVSGIERQVEVFFGQAQAVSLNWHSTLSMPLDVSRRETRETELAEELPRDPLIAQMMVSIPFDRWAAYRTRYQWQPRFENMGAPDYVSRILFLNGERDYMDIPLDEAARHARLPIPRYMQFAAMVDGELLSHQITFDEDEIMTAFSRLSAGDRPLELVFAYKVQDGASTFVVLLRSSQETVALTRARLEVSGT
jgi:hypothetical protein